MTSPIFNPREVVSVPVDGDTQKAISSDWAYDHAADLDAHDITRSATLVVAASNSLASSKAQADYVCDGTDDQVEIQAAIDALPAGGGKVQLSEGQFNISSTILISKSPCLIEGMGGGYMLPDSTQQSITTIFLSNGSDCDMIANADVTWRILQLHHIKLNGNKANQAIGHGINWNYLDIGGHYTVGLFDTVIRNCKQDGIHFDLAANVGFIYASHFVVAENDQDGISCNGANYNIQGIQLMLPNWIQFNGRHGLYLKGGGDNWIEAYIESNADTGAYLQSLTTTFIRIWTKSNGNRGAYLWGDFTGSITDIISTNNGSAGNREVVVDGVSNLVLRLNIEGTAIAVAHGLALQGTIDRLVVSGRIKVVAAAFAVRFIAGLVITNSIMEGCILVPNATGNVFSASVPAGLRVYGQHCDIFMDVLGITANHVRNNQDLSLAIPLTFGIDAQPDVPRTLSGHFDAHANITAYTIEITGVDAKGNTIAETKTEADLWDWETNNAFKVISSIVMKARTGTGGGDTMDIGITDVLGLSNEIASASVASSTDVYGIKKNNANAPVAGAQMNAAYDTYDMAVIGLAATDDFTIWYRSNLNIVS